MSIHVVLVQPEIHWNTGNAGRTCLAAGATLHLIKPLGFSLDDREIKRAGLDYWQHVDLRVWDDWACFEQELPAMGTPYFFSTKGTQQFWDAPMGSHEGVVLIFGRETGGLPTHLHERYRDQFVTMPMHSTHVRSLNLSTSVAIATYEVLRQRAAGSPQFVDRDGAARPPLHDMRFTDSLPLAATRDPPTPCGDLTQRRRVLHRPGW